MALARLGILGDIHAEDRRLAAALSCLAELGCDAVLAVGDIVDGAGSVDVCCKLLVDHGVIVVRGNHERWFLAGTMRDLPDATAQSALSSAAWDCLAALPPSRTIATVTGNLLLCHGLGDDDMATVKPDDFGYALQTNDALHALIRERRYRYVVAGHSHRRMVRSFDDLTIINAGTLYREHEPCFGHVDLVEKRVRFYRADGNAPAQVLEEFALP